jgi:hypothetical protein
VVILKIFLDGEAAPRREMTETEKINSKGIEYQNVDGQQRATLSGNDVMKSFVVPRDSAVGAPDTNSKYERAPGEEINNQSILAMNAYNQSADEQRVNAMESDCASLQQQIASMVKQQ